jgi:peptide/nickel transport system substrate-binding protein
MALRPSEIVVVSRGGFVTKRILRLLALTVVLGLAAAACGGGGSSSSTTESPGGGTPTTTSSGGGTTPPSSATPTGNGLEQGGTMKLILTSGLSGGIDPQKAYYNLTFEFLRCCLNRTLMAFPGTPDAQVKPDLAASDPEISADGLTWTFHLKPGVHYAPPLQDTTVTSGDIVRALEREACAECAAGGYSFYYSPIKGFDDFAGGKAKTISGLATPDDQTLVITLTQKTGDLPFRLALPAAGPIPPNPDDPSAALGIATGHDKEDYGRFMVGTGPYMIEGSDQLDFSGDPKSQKPASGWDPDKSLVFVRNPSWQSDASDDLRPAFADKIDIEFSTASPEDIYAKIDRGEADWTDALEPTDILQRYTQDPDLKDQVHVTEGTVVRYLEFNLATPPFDDVHVRKAVNFAVDREGLRQLRGGEIFGTIAQHDIINSLTGDLLKDYAPYSDTSDINAAKDEMKQSKYDSNGDGVCDDPACKGILAINDEGDPYPAQANLIKQNLAGIGITLNVKAFDRGTMYGKCSDPATQDGLCLAPGWGQDYPDAVTFGPPLFGKAAIGPDGCCNRSLVGADSKTLQKFGYKVTSVPSVEADLKKCSSLEPGQERLQCWADFDKKVTEEIVTWVPYLFDNDVELVSANLVGFTYDAFAGDISLDHTALLSANPQ